MKKSINCIYKSEQFTKQKIEKHENIISFTGKGHQP